MKNERRHENRPDASRHHIYVDKMKRLLILSYYANMPGACQAEWIDDKIDSITSSSYQVSVVSSDCANRYSGDGIDHWRISSISATDYLDERRRILDSGKKPRARDWLMLPLVLTIGFLVDFTQYLTTRGLGEGRWSWAIPAFIASSIACITDRPFSILSTGGPASAHLAAILAGKIFHLPVIVELQDPLSGDGIGRNAQARGWLYKVEKIIVKYATKVVYVTEGAANFAREQFNSNKIVHVYPGAKRFDTDEATRKKQGSKFRMVHLGSLYATRTFSEIMSALESLIEQEKISCDDIELINLGHVAGHIRREIEEKPYVKIMAPVSRIEALKFAANCDATLLIQNSDDRSQVTIPYKTYDYLNLKTPIIALLNSSELTVMLSEAGHNAMDLKDLDGIAAAVYKLMKAQGKTMPGSPFLDPVMQAQKLLSLT